MGEMARYVNRRYPNVQQLFLHSRIYAGYATTRLNPEPFAYEYGFSTKWLIEAQILQLRNGTVRPHGRRSELRQCAVDRMGAIPLGVGRDPKVRRAGLVATRFSSGCTHPSRRGVQKVTNVMMGFYLSSPYSPWFRADQNSAGKAYVATLP